MANYEIQDLIGARNLSKSGMSLLSQVGIDNFMGLDISGFIVSYKDFVQPIHEDIVPVINQKTPRIELIV